MPRLLVLIDKILGRVIEVMYAGPLHISWKIAIFMITFYQKVETILFQFAYAFTFLSLRLCRLAQVN